jgi:hypothetical protein
LPVFGRDALTLKTALFTKYLRITKLLLSVARGITDNFKSTFKFEEIDDLEIFQGTHPALMRKRVDAQDWEFEFDKKKCNFSAKDKMLHCIEKRTGWRIGEYRNYILIK